MGIYRNGKEVSLVYYGEMAVKAIYRGATLIWNTIRSCFGSGRWDSTKPWIGDDKWKNEP